MGVEKVMVQEVVVEVVVDAVEVEEVALITLIKEITIIKGIQGDFNNKVVDIIRVTVVIMEAIVKDMGITKVMGIIKDTIRIKEAIITHNNSKVDMDKIHMEDISKQ